MVDKLRTLHCMYAYAYAHLQVYIGISNVYECSCCQNAARSIVPGDAGPLNGRHLVSCFAPAPALVEAYLRLLFLTASLAMYEHYSANLGRPYLEFSGSPSYTPYLYIYPSRLLCTPSRSDNLAQGLYLQDDSNFLMPFTSSQR